MTTLSRVARLSLSDAVFLLGCWLTVATVRAGLSSGQYPRLLRSIPRTRDEPTPLAVLKRTAWGVAAASRLVPGATCLTQALSAKYLLARAGHRSDLEVGVRSGTGVGFEAHAWLMSEGKIVTGGTAADLSRFVKLTSIHPPKR